MPSDAGVPPCNPTHRTQLTWRAECECGLAMGGVVFDDRIEYLCPRCDRKFKLIFLKEATPDAMNINLDELNVYDDGDLIVGLARKYLFRAGKLQPDCYHMGGQSYNAWIGRLLRALKELDKERVP